MGSVRQIRPGYYGQRNQRPKPPPRFIYELPFREHKEIEDLLNMNDSWETLAGDHLGLTLMELDKLRRYNQKPCESAASALLTFLEQKNTQILDLYFYLNKIQLYRGMDILKQYVPSKYHLLIRSGPQLKEEKSSKIKDAVEPLTACATYRLPDKIPPDHFLPPAVATTAPVPQIIEQETRSQNLTVLAADAGGQQPLLRADWRPQQLHPPQHQPTIGGTFPEHVSPSLMAGTLSNGRPAGSGISLPPACDGPQAVSFRNQQSIMVQDFNPFRRRNISESTVSSVGSVASGVPNVSITDLGLACGNWSPEQKIGEGGYGEVYMGEWQHQAVAIKRIRRDKFTSCNETQHKRCIEQCFQEIIFLNKLKSEFIIPILAFSDSQDPCIVYQYMPNGSLLDRLKKKQGSPALSWKQRYEIALGCANGLQFLHSTTKGDKKLVHGDIKSANILLDKNFQPKIGDFGLAQEIEYNQSKVVLTTIYGTQFYLPNDFLRDKQLTSKVDTYSYGVILFELVTGKQPNYRVNPETRSVLLDVMKNESDFGKWVDKSWPDHLIDIQISAILYKFGKWCANDRKKLRPEMEEVYLKLKASLRKESMGGNSPSPLELQIRYDSLDQNNGLQAKKSGPPPAQFTQPEADLIQFLSTQLQALPPLDQLACDTLPAVAASGEKNLSMQPLSTFDAHQPPVPISTIPVSVESSTLRSSSSSSTLQSSILSELLPSTVPSVLLPSTVPNDLLPSTVPNDLLPSTVPNDLLPSTVPNDLLPSTVPSVSLPSTVPNAVSSTQLSSCAVDAFQPSVLSDMVASVTPCVPHQASPSPRTRPTPGASLLSGQSAFATPSPSHEGCEEENDLPVLSELLLLPPDLPLLSSLLAASGACALQHSRAEARTDRYGSSGEMGESSSLSNDTDSRLEQIESSASNAEDLLKDFF